MTKPEFPRPKVGDQLLVVVPGDRYRDEQIIPVRVEKVARFRVTLAGHNGDRMSFDCREFDLRTGSVWTTRHDDRMSSRRGPRLYTAELWAWTQREQAASKYFRDQGMWIYELRGSLGNAAKADMVGFANALRRFEGLEEI